MWVENTPKIWAHTPAQIIHHPTSNGVKTPGGEKSFEVENSMV